MLAGSAALRDLPTCAEADRVGDIAPRVHEGPLDGVVVTNEQGIVMGLLPAEAVDADGDATVGEVMAHGPTTVRPSEDLAELRHRMQHAGASAVLLTTPAGALIGAVLSE